jgi:hypothetical protein
LISPTTCLAKGLSISLPRSTTLIPYSLTLLLMADCSRKINNPNWSTFGLAHRAPLLLRIMVFLLLFLFVPLDIFFSILSLKRVFTSLDAFINMFIQIQGAKRFILIPPSLHLHLYLHPYIHPSSRQSRLRLEVRMIPLISRPFQTNNSVSLFFRIPVSSLSDGCAQAPSCFHSFWLRSCVTARRRSLSSSFLLPLRHGSLEPPRWLWYCFSSCIILLSLMHFVSWQKTAWVWTFGVKAPKLSPGRTSFLCLFL